MSLFQLQVSEMYYASLKAASKVGSTFPSAPTVVPNVNPFYVWFVEGNIRICQGCKSSQHPLLIFVLHVLNGAHFGMLVVL